MKRSLLLVLLAITFGSHAQTAPAKINPVYNAELAKKLGADEYGMHQYVMAFLKTGPAKITDKAEMAELQKAHLKNIIKLANEGKLVVAGPFMDKGDVEGVFIFNVATVAEAKALPKPTLLLKPVYW